MPGYFVSVPRAFREVCKLGAHLAGLTTHIVAPRWMAWRYLHAEIHNVIAPLPFLFAYLVPAVLILGLRQPRPSWSAFVRQSGVGGCLLIVVSILFRLDLWWLDDQRLPFFADVVFAGLLCWAVLGRRPWRAKPTWLDRLGRGVAGYWAVAFLIRAADHLWFGCGG
jgi:hypothetical protein